ncbi:Kinesin-like protein KIF15 [Neolecta irregularis DAH-3]|uniref:Kinesin-like protein KIF15 n=1 Tax=Neolecta irregularis (strain DAH-3) TaxID=1198029 RepID=A0A1U7LSA8_NEOID|nr:Kinesin-like protein KIF15 [Neolecta irregularis DAH-3]|eukprot:OLL25547.1 Kinesin-like protein KIF15 [Neolecta irregularis DAH-3]
MAPSSPVTGSFGYGVKQASTPRSASRMSRSSNISGDDGKTAVKVAIRVRPPLEPGMPGYELIPQRFQKPVVNVLNAKSLSIDTPQSKKTFIFDRVFGADIDQVGVMDWVLDSVEAFLQGYNVSILAYGQSGAGKSFTMGTAGKSDPELRGQGLSSLS